ncbi:MAG TPA: hypothetical protein VIT67_21865, partial [Povalibacter sp.]
MAAPALEYQYLLSGEDISHPPSFRAITIAGIKIAFDPRFRVIELRDMQGAQFAVVIGFPYDNEQGDFLQADSLTLPIQKADTAAVETNVLP